MLNDFVVALFYSKLNKRIKELLEPYIAASSSLTSNS